MIQPYYQTDNAPLAITLALLGVPPARINGEPMPQLMLYTPEQLRKMGYTGMSVDAAAQQAIKDRRSGTRVFQFERTPELEEIIKTFRVNEAKQKTSNPVTIERLETEDVIAVAVAFNALRTVMLSGFDIPAFIGLMGDIESNTKYIDGKAKYCRGDDGKFQPIELQTARGSFCAISVGASKALQNEVAI